MLRILVALRTRHSITFLSAYGRDEIIARAFEAGATDYVVKPFSPTELVQGSARLYAGDPVPLRPNPWSHSCWAT